jgi:hypothetical protein
MIVWIVYYVRWFDGLDSPESTYRSGRLSTMDKKHNLTMLTA